MWTKLHLNNYIICAILSLWCKFLTLNSDVWTFPTCSDKGSALCWFKLRVLPMSFWLGDLCAIMRLLHRHTVSGYVCVCVCARVWHSACFIRWLLYCLTVVLAGRGLSWHVSSRPHFCQPLVPMSATRRLNPGGKHHLMPTGFGVVLFDRC